MTTGVPRALVSCVAESDASWSERVLMLARSLRLHGGTLSTAPFVANFVGRLPECTWGEFDALGVTVSVVPPFDAIYPWTNKLRMLEMPDLFGYDVLLALDCDVAVMGDVSLYLSARAVRAAVDSVNLGDDDWRFIYEAFGLPAVKNGADPYGRIAWPYYNTGVLSIPVILCHDLLQEWTKALEVVRALQDARPGLFLQRNFVDQIAFTMAMQTGGFALETLPHSMNCFTGGFVHGRPIALAEPFVLHYHQHRDRRGFLRRSGDRRVDEHIHRFNQERATLLGVPYKRPRGRAFAQWMLRRSTWSRRIIQALWCVKRRTLTVLRLVH